MMDSWPEEHGQGYKTALQACTGQLTTPEQVEAARQAFLAATEEAALVVVGAEHSVGSSRGPSNAPTTTTLERTGTNRVIVG